MDRRTALPVGFAVLVLLAVVGMLTLFSFTAVQPTEASNLPASDLTLGEIDGEIDTARFNPIVATAAVSGATFKVALNPNKAGVVSSFEFTFLAPNELANGVDEIIITWDKDFKNFPSTISTSSVTIRATKGSCSTSGTEVTTCGVTGAYGNEGQAVAPHEVNVDFVTPQTADLQPQTRLRVPDMDTDDGSGGNAIREGATVVIVFRQSAGISSFSENDLLELDLRVTDQSASPTDAGFSTAVRRKIFTQARMQMSNNDGKRGKNFTLIASGVEGKESVTFWRDADGDGTRDSIERDVCNVVADSDDTATCTFTISNPPFAPAKFENLDSLTDVNGAVAIDDTTITVDDGTLFTSGQSILIDTETFVISGPGATGVTVVGNVLTVGAATAAHVDNSDVTIVGNCTYNIMHGCNFINFVDAEGRTTTGTTATSLVGGDVNVDVTALNPSTKAQPLDQEAVDRQVFELDQTINATPNTGNVGDTLVISLFDWPVSSAVTSMQLAGIAVGLPSTIPSTSASGEVTFNFDLPGVGTSGERIPTGKIPLKVYAGGANEDVNITLAGANLTISHDTVLANQDLTITGSGFSEGTDLCVVEGKITIANVAVEFDDTSDCPAATLAAQSPAASEGILLSSGGTFTLTVRVHDTTGTSPALNTALLTEGVMELKVIDTSGSEGTIPISIGTRSLEINPASARPRDYVTIIGKAFIADNADGLSTSVEITYKCGSNTRVVTADPDVSGNFREELRIPSNCAIPSTNTVTAAIKADSTATGVVESVAHSVPASLVSIEPGRGASGSLVTVVGTGFRVYESVAAVQFGGLGTLGGRTVTTDKKGDFRIEDVMVPGLDPGVHAVKVEVSTGTNKVTASTSFEVVEDDLVGLPTPVADAYAMSDSLLRIFRFDNSTKVWAFNDPRPEFDEANTLDEIVSGGVYWLLIDQDVSLDTDGGALNLTCIAGPPVDCWNLITWP